MDTVRPLPNALERLRPLAYDLRLTGSKTMAQVWRRLDPEAWDRTNNPHIVLLHAHQDRLEEAAADPQLLAMLDSWFARRDAIETSAGWFGSLPGSDALTGIAYFSMEFGLSEALPIYSGGLGILAGDHLKSANDLGVPVVGIGLLYQQGYFRQVLGWDGEQLAAFPFNDPGSLPVQPVLDADGRWPRVRLELPGRTLLLRVWQAMIGRVRLYLLDSNHPLNSPWDRGITANLYDAGREKRLLQELVLGVGGYRLLEKLGIEAQVCHLNEGHAAFAVVARAAAFARAKQVPFDAALRATRAGNVFTTHTPVDAAFDRFDPGLVLHFANPLIAEAGVDPEAFLGLGRKHPGDRSEPFNMAYLAMRGSNSINGVARLHGEVSRKLFAGLFPGWPVTDVPVGLDAAGGTVYRGVADKETALTEPGLIVYRFDAPLVFANAAFFTERLEGLIANAGPGLKCIILDAEPISDFDSTAAEALEILDADLERIGVDLWIPPANGPLRQLLTATGLTKRLGAEHIYPSVRAAVTAYHAQFGTS